MRLPLRWLCAGHGATNAPRWHCTPSQVNVLQLKRGVVGCAMVGGTLPCPHIACCLADRGCHEPHDCAGRRHQRWVDGKMLLLHCWKQSWSECYCLCKDNLLCSGLFGLEAAAQRARLWRQVAAMLPPPSRRHRLQL